MKKIVIILFLAITVLCLGVFINYKLGLSTKYNSFVAERDLEKGTVQMISYGLPMIDANLISQRYGFKTIEAGCTVFPIEINGIKEYNLVVTKYLTKINGADWQIKYRKSCDSLISVVYPRKNKQ